MESEEFVEKLHKIVKSAVESLGYNVWGIEYSGTQRGGILRVYIDSPSGVSISDCTTVSKHLDVLLDVEDPIHGPYTLEVSSPGLERKFFSLAQIEPYIGKKMRVKLKFPMENRKKWRGYLKKINPSTQELFFDIDGEEIVFKWEDIENISLLYWEK